MINEFIQYCRTNITNDRNIYLIAHNCNAFDKVFLERKLFECCIELPHWRYLDSLHLSQYLLKNRKYHSLRSLCRYWNLVQKNAHRAMSDVEDLEKIFELLIHMWEYTYGETSIYNIYKFLLPKK